MKSIKILGALILGILLFLYFQILFPFHMGIYYTNKALKNNDPELCKAVPVSYDGNTSPYKCYMTLLTENKNLRACDNIISVNNYTCLKTYAYLIAKENEPGALVICGKIPDSFNKKDCIAGVG